MNGLLFTRNQQSGRMFLKLIATSLILVLFLSACSADWWVGDGRGDWTLDLCKGYAISKINSDRILFVHKKNPSDSGGAIVIDNYFVMAYQMYEPYICLEGIRTQKLSASEEELNRMELIYYLVDTTNGEVAGPFETHDDFVEHCSSIGLTVEAEWLKPQK